MKTIALVCPSTSGHHETYLRLFTRALVQLDHNVEVITPAAERLRQWVNAQLPTTDQVHVHELNFEKRFRLPGILSIWSDKVDWVRFTAERIKAAGIHPDLVFHTWLDNCLTPGLSASLTDLLFPYRWSGLYFHPWYLRHSMRFSSLRHGLLANHAALHSTRCPALGVLDEGIARTLHAQLHGKPVIVFPDIADATISGVMTPLAEEIRMRAAQRKIVSLLGILTKRKGLLMAMEVAMQVHQADYFFVFAGPYSGDAFSADDRLRFESFVASAPSNCFFHFAPLQDGAEFNALVAVSDILFAVYLGFFSSSNLLTKAALFHKPLVVSDAALMGERVRAYDLGLAIDETSTAQCIAALHELVQPNKLPSPRYDDYARLHSVEQLTVSIKTLLAADGI